MKQIVIGEQKITAPAIITGCMRLADFDKQQMNHFIHASMDLGVNIFDHADIYGDGRSEEIFGKAMKGDASLHREDMLIQSKCGIKKGYYDLSRNNILDSVDNILKRLQTEYLDFFLLHRPDALVEPEEVAIAFDTLKKNGKVRHFGVSNHKPMQIELLQKYVEQPLVINQMQFSIPVSNMVANGMEVNMETPGAADRDGSVLDYCRLHDITIQAWSPFQMPGWKGCFLGAKEYPDLNQKIQELAEKYHVSETTIATSWILRHPAKMQVIAGTTSEDRLKEIAQACSTELNREEWYQLYLAAGHPLP